MNKSQPIPLSDDRWLRQLVELCTLAGSNLNCAEFHRRLMIHLPEPLRAGRDALIDAASQVSGRSPRLRCAQGEADMRKRGAQAGLRREGGPVRGAPRGG